MNRGDPLAGKKPALSILSLACLSLLLAACGALAPEPTPTATMPPPTATLPPPTATPPPFAQAGHWETVGEAFSPVSFDVTEQGEIINFNILVTGECDVTVNMTIPFGSAHNFVIGPVDAGGQPVDNGIVGTFDTPTTASGTIDGSWDCPLSTGGVTTFYLPTQVATWTAEWQGP